MKFVSLISSGIDSPVATYFISKKIEEIILLHADGRPFYDEKDIKNFLALAKYLKQIIPVKIKLFIIPHGETLSTYLNTSHHRYTCVFCKRMLVRYAEKIAIKEAAEIPTIISFLRAFLPIFITAVTTTAMMAALSPLKADATQAMLPYAA